MQKIYLEAFDTQLEFLLCVDGNKGNELRNLLKSECARYENLFSRTVPSSDVAKINSSNGRWVEVSADTYDLIQVALEYCKKTDGLYDITIAPLVKLWDFKEKCVPSDNEICEALRHVAWSKVELKSEGTQGDSAQGDGTRSDGPRCEGRHRDGTRYYVRLQKPACAIDLGGIAKGYIADALGKLLKQQGVENFLINLGGNILCSGAREDGGPWVVGVKSPKSELENASCSLALDAAPAMDNSINCHESNINNPRSDSGHSAFASGNEPNSKNFAHNSGHSAFASGNEPNSNNFAHNSSHSAFASNERVLKKLRVHNASVVTSGIYERFFIKDNQLYHHIIDPRTGKPARSDTASVTVCATNSIDAEGFSTALLIAGSEKGAAFAKRQPEIMAAYFYDKNDNLLAC